jgi:hypothetical protein
MVLSEARGLSLFLVIRGGISCTAKRVLLTPIEKSNGEWRMGPRTIAITSLPVLDESWTAPVKHLGQPAGYTILGLNDGPRPKVELLHLYVLIPSFQKQLPRDTKCLVIRAIARLSQSCKPNCLLVGALSSLIVSIASPARTSSRDFVAKTCLLKETA